MFLIFGIRRLPIFPGSAHMVAVRCGEAASFSSLCLSSSCSLLRPPGALTVDPITSPWLFDLARKIPTHQRPKKNTMRCMVFFFGIRRLPIFPPEAPTVRQGRSASQTLLELPALLDLLFASSSTGRAHSRSHHQPLAGKSDPGNSNRYI